MELKRLNSEEIEDVLSLLKEFTYDTTGVDDAWTYEELINMINSDNDINLGLYIEEKLIGLVLTHCYNAANKVYVENIIVSKEYQRQGYGTRLLLELISEYSKKGNYRFVALVNKKNVASRKLFSKIYEQGQSMIWFQRKKEKQIG